MLLLTAAAGPAMSSDRVRIEAHNERGFGRLVLDFDRLPDYRNEVSSGVLVISFDSAVQADLSDIVEALPDYVVLARSDPDGRAMRLALSRSFRINVMEAGSALYIDLLPPEWAGAPPPLPADVVRELGRKALEAEERARKEAEQRAKARDPYKLDVRLARHPTFTRIAFEWNRFVTVGLTRAGGDVTLAFDRQAPVDLSRLRVDGPHFLRSAVARELERGMEVALTVDEDVDVRGFREGLTYIVDLTGPDAALDVAGRLAADAVDSAASRRDGDADRDRAGERRGVLRLSGEGAEREPPPVADGPVSGAEVPDVAFERVDLDALADAGGGARDRESRRPEDDQPPVETRDDMDARTAFGDGEPGATGDAPVKVSVERSGESLTLAFPFAESVAAAAFRRGRYVWLVFDTEATFDSAALRDSAAASMVADVRHGRDGPMQYFVFELAEPWLSYVERKDYAWVVNVGNMVTGRSRPLSLVRALRDDMRSMVRIALEDAGRVHWIADPVFGDRLAVVTAHGPPRAVPKRHSLVDFQALATAHGIAIRPNVDDLAVRLAVDDVLVTRHRGLALSPGFARQYVPGRKGLEVTGRPSFVDFAAWREADPAVLSRRVAELKRAIATSPAGERQSIRMDLARLYLANGLTAESIGVMRQMRDEDIEVESDPVFNAVRGAALTLMRRPEEAAKDFAVHALANDPHTALWRGLAAAMRGDDGEALRAFESGAEAIGAYPADVQARFRLAAARTALRRDDPSRAGAELEALPRAALPRPLAERMRLVQGLYFDRVGRIEEAMQAYEAVLAGDYEPARAEARLARIELMRHLGDIDPEEATRQLELAQLLWRGGEIELRTMRQLADLYVAQQRHREAFELMTTAMQAYSDSPLAKLIQDDMKLVFEDLFLHGQGDAMRPVDALALYYEFRDLTPVGRRGDDMIRRLSDRLISVDLLDQAAELLEHQVESRLSGAARAQVATRLAMVQLMNRKPDLALRAIRRTRQAGLPDSLLHRRNLLEARALGELGRAEAAIEVLDSMEGEEAERLKADALWIAQEWSRAGEQIERLLAARWRSSAPLEDDERFDVLRAAISYALADDQFALDRLRSKFYDHMIETPDAETFAFVTQPVHVARTELRQLVTEIAVTGTLDAFMREFRRRYDNPPAAPPIAETG